LGRQVYGDRPKLLAQLEIEAADGTRAVIATDTDWRCAYGQVLQADLLMGEHRDLRLGNESCYPALEFNHEVELGSSPAPPVRVLYEKGCGEPKPFGEGKKRRWVYKFPTNAAGRVRLKIDSRPGQTVTVRHAERTNPDGSIYTDNLLTAQSTDRLTLPGGSVEIEPQFTYHGFQYAEIAGLEEPLSKRDVSCAILTSALPRTFDVLCKNRGVRALVENVTTSLRANFIDVPTDCPQRDERMGWTGDIQVFADTAAYQTDASGFLTKWLRDLVDAQGEDGRIPATAPNPGEYPDEGGPGWSDALLTVPMTLYRFYRDKRVLREVWPAVLRYLGFLERTSRDGTRCGDWYDGFHGYGDWLAIGSMTPKDLIATAWFARASQLGSQIAGILGEDGERMRLEDLHQTALSAFLREFGDEQRVLRFPTQTALCMALAFGLVDDRQAALDALVADVEARGDHLSTGFLGTPLILEVLAEGGRIDVADRLLLQRTPPSWFYQLQQGATSIWERWDGWSEEHGFQDPAMNSFNHYALGSVAKFIYERVGGISVDGRHFTCRPWPRSWLKWSEASYSGRWGCGAITWSLRESILHIRVGVPPGGSGTLEFPPGFERDGTLDLGPGAHVFELRQLD
jgi:alpha-L-rhamnosidase